MSEPIPRWTPTADIRDHAGAAIASDAVFFAEPPPQIGTVLSAHSGLYRAGPASGRPIARKVLGLFMLFGLIIGGFLGFGLSRGSGVGALVGASVGIGMIGGLIHARQTRNDACTYVGALGIARFPKAGSSPPELLLFADAGELQSSFLGRRSGTSYTFQWRDSQGKCLFRLQGGYYGTQQSPDPDSQYHFGLAAERAWTAHRLPQALKEIETQGSTRFITSRVPGNRRYALVGRDFLELPSGSGSVRLPAEEIEDVVVHLGAILIRRRGASINAMPSPTGSNGVFQLSYGVLSDASLFVFLLEKVVGVQVRTGS